MENWLEKDLKYIWHPYTQMHDLQTLPPILVERARGIKLYDDKGNCYYDTISSWWCNVHGHNHPRIKEAIRKQLNSLEHVLFAGFTHRPAITLAEKLISVAPKNLTRVFFSDNGSTAVETALKMSFQYWQNTGHKEKRQFIALDHGYHGDTVGAMSLSGVDLFNEVFQPLCFASIKVPSPYCYRCPIGKEYPQCEVECTQPLETIIRNQHSKISAMILEPMVMGAAGIIVYPKEYLAKARELTREYGIHLIADEVAVGFGRTGKMFACEHANVQPDFMCLSKGITSGYLPLGATLTSEEIYQAFYADYLERKTFYHGHTYAANPLSCSAAIASLDLFQEEDTLNRIGKLVPLFREGLEGLRDLPCVGDIRSIGMIGAVELVRNKKLKTPFNFEERIGFEVYKRGLANGLLLRPLGDVIYLFLPLCVKKRELATILDSYYEIIKEIKP